MYKLYITILKDFRILMRDKVGLTLMFVMPILLVLVMTSIQNSTFELVNNKKLSLIVWNKDTAQTSKEFVLAISKMGMFKVESLDLANTNEDIKSGMANSGTLVALIIPSDFTDKIKSKALKIAQKSIDEPNTGVTKKIIKEHPSSLTLLYNPVLDESFRRSVQGAMQSTLQLIEGRQTIQTLYTGILSKPMPSDLESDIIEPSLDISLLAVSKDGSGKIPNATQHNVPAWTLFAMFFIVISLGSSIVREKQSGSFIRLKTLPTTYFVAIISKQLTYLTVTLFQVFVIFSLGLWFFPFLKLPVLSLPSDLLGLALVSVICGWSAVSYAICVGVIASTQEQANGFGAVSIVILSAIGGIMVPSFAMPGSFDFILNLSPLYWGLKCYYVLFLEQGKFIDLVPHLLPLLLFIAVMQGITLYSLKRKNLI
ncbi:MAG: ABC transporter permease [Opitutaceae bacterium]|nr:ABC transporter permease [Cytophagales bacterium]